MIYVAIIENNIVKNIVVENDSWQNPNNGTCIVYDTQKPVNIGWSVVNNEIVNPNPVEKQISPTIILK